MALGTGNHQDRPVRALVRTAVLLLIFVAGAAACTAGPAATSTSSAPTVPHSEPAATLRSLPTVSAPADAPQPAGAAPRIPPVSAAQHAAGLVDIRTVVPDAIVDLRYATSDNFTRVRLYPADARCLVHESMAPGLTIAANRLRAAGYLLVFWDCYRPHAVQVRMFQVVPNPAWVARPGPYATSHEAGRSVDVTLARVRGGSCSGAQVQGHCLLDMGTGFDNFTARAHAYASAGVTTAEQAHRAVLRTAMAAGGLSVYSGEWWHFDGPGSATPRPHLNVPVN